jgi:hypothetical protein
MIRAKIRIRRKDLYKITFPNSITKIMTEDEVIKSSDNSAEHLRNNIFRWAKSGENTWIFMRGCANECYIKHYKTLDNEIK